MEKNTPPNLSKRLAKYGALTIALAGLTDVHGQVMYTDVDPDSAGTTTGGDLLFDIDGDGNNDLQFRQNSSNLFVEPLTGSLLGNPSGGSLDNYKYPYVLNFGAVISSAAVNWVSGDTFFQTLNYDNCYYGTGGDYNNWCNITDGYLGIRFQIGGNTHYGWARLDVGTLPAGWILKDYAYEATPDMAISAGNGILSNPDRPFEISRIVALNKSIALYNIPQTTSYRLYSLTGQSVLDGRVESETHVIEAGTLSTGIYIIELRDSETNAIKRKKLVL